MEERRLVPAFVDRLYVAMIWFALGVLVARLV